MWSVLDLYAGSGTEGKACANLGRRYLGMENDPNSHAIAVERITNALKGRLK